MPESPACNIRHPFGSFAPFREGRQSRSHSEMIGKTESVLQELEETAYWLELLAQARIVKAERIADLLKDAVN